MKSKFVLFALISIFAFACKKDKTAPTLVVSAPGDGAQASGIVIIKGTVADENLKNLTIKVVNSSGVTVFSKDLSLDGLSTYTFDEQYDPGFIITSGERTLTVEVSDKNLSKTSKVIKFTVVP